MFLCLAFTPVQTRRRAGPSWYAAYSVSLVIDRRYVLIGKGVALSFVARAVYTGAQNQEKKSHKAGYATYMSMTVFFFLNMDEFMRGILGVPCRWSGPVCRSCAVGAYSRALGPGGGVGSSGPGEPLRRSTHRSCDETRVADASAADSRDDPLPHRHKLVRS